MSEPTENTTDTIERVAEQITNALSQLDLTNLSETQRAELSEQLAGGLSAQLDGNQDGRLSAQELSEFAGERMNEHANHDETLDMMRDMGRVACGNDIGRAVIDQRLDTANTYMENAYNGTMLNAIYNGDISLPPHVVNEMAAAGVNPVHLNRMLRDSLQQAFPQGIEQLDADAVCSGVFNVNPGDEVDVTISR